MKRFWIISLIVLASAQLWAEDSIVSPMRPRIVDAMPGVELVQDSTVNVLLEAAMRGKMEWVEIDGYRVQVYSSNQQQTAKTEALELEEKLKAKIEIGRAHV